MRRPRRPPAPKTWPDLLQGWLPTPAARRVGSAQQWHRDAQALVGGAIPRRSFGLVLADWVTQGQLLHACHGMYVNRCLTPPVCALELVSGVRPLAIVSLHSALAQAGALPPSGDRVTCVLPTQAAARAGAVVTALGHLHFHGLHPRLWPKPHDAMAYALHPVPSVRLASPEKALLDWVYLAALTNGKALPDVPWEALDERRVDPQRLAALIARFALEEWWRHAPVPRVWQERVRAS